MSSFDSCGEYFNKPEGMYQLRLMKMRLIRCRYNNISSSRNYQTLKVDIERLTSEVDSYIDDLTEGTGTSVDMMAGIHHSVNHLSQRIHVTDYRVTEAMQDAIRALKSDINAINELYAKIINYITTIECYYRDLMDRTLIPEYTNAVIHHTYTLESFIINLYVMRNMILNQRLNQRLNPTSNVTSMLTDVQYYIRRTNQIVRCLPTDITLKSSIDIIKRIIEVYNSNAAAISAKPTIKSCCSNQHYVQDQHREKLKTALRGLVAGIPFTLDEATHHIRMYLFGRIEYHHCKNY
ncbi:hypothetical protein F-liban_183 [Faustovirus]|nr:hypothetical protein F-liban_183 [Faustovirus]